MVAKVLTGGSGRDYFVFDTALTGGNVDTITDFSNVPVVNSDTMRLATRVFMGLTGNAGSYLSRDQFVANVDGTAKDGNDHIVYNTSTAALFYDADGNGSGASIQFAQIGTGSTHPTLTNLDFFLI